MAEEEERCEEDPECHSSAKRARVCATFTDSQEVSIVEFVKLHPELYYKEHSRFHDRTRREALWAEISEELKLQPFDVRRWFVTYIGHYISTLYITYIRHYISALFNLSFMFIHCHRR